MKNEETIFAEASGIESPEARAAYLNQACGEDAALRQQVEGLLAAHDRASEFMQAPAPIPGVTSSTDSSQLASEAHAELEPLGATVGPYKLLERIGEGGMGVVYMADQAHPVRRRVALKIIKPGMDSRQVIARFEAERQALAVMDHPSIARVLDAGTTDAGRPYFAMELVKGVPITEYCDANHLTPRERLDLFVQVCQAVQHAHTKGVIHRDLKPTNILVTLHDGVPVPKIIDFGIAKATGGAAQQLTDKTLFTQFAQMVGTPLYMSPEQAEFSGLDVDTRSDIYSLGVLLYELLTGTTPFDKKRLGEAALDEVRRIIREEEPPRPSTRLGTLLSETLTAVSANRKTEPGKLGRSLRGELDWIVMKCLEKDRARRYETANGLGTDVRRYLADEAVQACPPSAAYKLHKFARRNRTTVVAASAITLALLLAIIVLAVSNLRITTEKNQKATALRDREIALAEKAGALLEASASERNARDQSFRALGNEAQARRFSRRMGQRLDSLAAVAEAARIRPEEGLRDEAIAAMALPDVRLGPVWEAEVSEWRVYDASYRFLADVDPQGLLSIVTVPDRREIRRIDSGRKTRSLVLSGDGAFLAQLDLNRTLRVWRVSDGQSVLRDELPNCSIVAFSPDGGQLAACQELSIIRVDLATGLESNRWRTRAPVCVLAFHADNRKLAVGYADAEITSVYDATDGALVGDLPVGPIRQQRIAWHPHGDRLAVVGGEVNPRIQIWDFAARRKLVTLQGPAQQVEVLSFHPDGNLLLSGSWDGVFRLWHAGSGREVLQWPMLAHAGFSSDGRWVGVGWLGGRRYRHLEVVPCPEYRTLVSSLGADQGDYHEGDISPDGRLLALGMGDGVRLWDLAAGRELTFLPIEATWNVRFQPDGRGLFTCGPGGLRRWSIQGSEIETNGLRLGPPQLLALPITPWRIALDRDGSTLAVVSQPGGAAMLIDPDDGRAAGPLLAHPSASCVALSHDARWIATSGWHSHAVRLWRAEDGKMIKEWNVVTNANVFFTPDSRTLIICDGDEFRFWDVETLQMTHRVRRDVPLYPGHVAFSPDGLLMALEMAPGVIHLKEVKTTRTVAKLQDPGGDRSTWMGFSPGGTQLVVAAQYARAVHVWDLRLIRVRLKTIGLDWDWPEFAAATEADPSRQPDPKRPLRIEVISN
jgi:serine/threonine protein kinase/WD40 repeat protein